jgi:hypothetical protein
MNKRNFIKTIGLAGAGLALTNGARAGDTPNVAGPTACVLVPTEIAGPFPLDLTDSQFFFRQDIREDRAGVPFRFRMKVLGEENCLPMPDARVHIWHCDKDGQYSGYDVATNPGQDGLTYLRGYQITDANGEVEFVTIFPGWYPGRVCHFHFQVLVNSTKAATSQLTFVEPPKQQLYQDHAVIYDRGIDPIAISQDGAFVDGAELQTASLEVSDGAEPYTSFLEVAVRGSGVTSVGYQERMTAQQFELGQSFPNPAVDQATIPLTMHHPGHVLILLYDLNGRELGVLHDGDLGVGSHSINLPSTLLRATSTNIVYQAVVTNPSGRWTNNKVVTKLR